MLLGIPTLCRYDLLDELLASAEAGELRPSGYFIVDNGGGYTRERLSKVLGERVRYAELLIPGRNLGVAASWNRMLDYAGNQPIVISNDDIRFGPSTFRELAEGLGKFPFVEGDGWALFGQHSIVREVVGYYDENFWPAYYEDVDYDLRMGRQGIVPKQVLSTPVEHVGWATTRSQKDAQWLTEGRERNHQYFLRKWGAESSNPRWNGHDGMVHFANPFDGKVPTGWRLRGGTNRPDDIAVMRWDVLNHIARRIGAKRYLEIGVANGDTMRRIEVEEKWGVDPFPNPDAVRESSAFAPVTSEKFFGGVARNAGKFDLVFIDGDHMADLVYKEVRAALTMLARGGIIVLHDCNPHTEAMQTVPMIQSEWTGDVWKAVVRLRREGIQVRVIDSDYGVGVLIPPLKPMEAAQPVPAELGLALTWENLVRYRREWLGLLDPWEWKDWLEEALMRRAALAQLSASETR